MNTNLQNLYRDLSVIERDINNMCIQFGFSINFFYSFPNKLPKEFLIQSCDKIEQLHDILEDIFKIQNEEPEKVKFLVIEGKT